MSADVLPFRRPDSGPEPWVRTAKVAAHFDKSDRTIRNWAGPQGDGRPSMPSLKRRNGSRLFRLSECERWLEQQA